MAPSDRSPRSSRNEWVVFDLRRPVAVSAFKYRTREGKSCPRECLLQCSGVYNDKWCDMARWQANKKSGWECVHLKPNRGNVQFPVCQFWRLQVSIE